MTSAPHHLSRAEARRVAVQAQLLAQPRPTDVVDVVRRLAVVQAEPTSAIAPSADLVLGSRIGTSYDVATLRAAIDEQRIIEHQGFLRPIEDMALLRAEMAVWPGTGALKEWQVGRAAWVEANDGCRRDLLERLRSLGIARATTPAVPGESFAVGDVGEPAVVEGVRGTWRFDPEVLATPYAGRAALLSPFDRLVQDRKRLTEIFEFEYLLEMYKPAAKRRWGYYALPILYGDRLVGKLDASADRAEGALVVRAVHEDEPFDAATTSAIDDEIDVLGAWLGLDVVRLDHGEG